MFSAAAKIACLGFILLQILDYRLFYIYFFIFQFVTNTQSFFDSFYGIYKTKMKYVYNILNVKNKREMRQRKLLQCTLCISGKFYMHINLEYSYITHHLNALHFLTLYRKCLYFGTCS